MTCPICDDMGIVPPNTEHNNTNRARECICRVEKRVARLLLNAAIPPRYEYATLNNYNTNFPGVDNKQKLALMHCRTYVAEYPMLADKGLVLTGNIGTGKTHLAVGIIRELINLYGVRCYFADQQALFQQLKDSYDPNSPTTGREVMNPALTSEVLVIDDLGVVKLSDWASDTVSLLLTSRYNNKLTTIITTNYPVGFTPQAPSPEGNVVSIQPVLTQQNLGERITDRVLSRLLGTSAVLNILGNDYRATVKKAHF